MAIEQDSPFLRLPTELRLQIYNHTPLSGIVTITSAPSGTGAGALISGLPFDHLPVVRQGYHRDWLLPVVSTLHSPSNVPGSTGLSAARGPQRLPRGPLSPSSRRRGSFGLYGARVDYGAICSCSRVSCWENHQRPCHTLEHSPSRYSALATEAASRPRSKERLWSTAKELQHDIQVTQEVEEGTREPSPDNLYLTSTTYSLYNAFSSLRLTSHQIHRELSDLPCNSSNTPLDLYLSYPAGVCVVMHCYPHLLRSARTIQICGTFDLAAVRIPIDYRRPDGDEWKADVENLNDDNYT